MKTLLEEIEEARASHLKANEVTYHECLAEENTRLNDAYEKVLTTAYMLDGSDPTAGMFHHHITPSGNLRFVVVRPGDAVEFLNQETAEVDMLSLLFEETGWSGNGELYEVAPEDIGALTSAPIITDELNIEDDGARKVLGEVWWYPNYMVSSWVEVLRETGEVIFTHAPAGKDVEDAKDNESSD